MSDDERAQARAIDEIDVFHSEDNALAACAVELRNLMAELGRLRTHNEAAAQFENDDPLHFSLAHLKSHNVLFTIACCDRIPIYGRSSYTGFAEREYSEYCDLAAQRGLRGDRVFVYALAALLQTQIPGVAEHRIQNMFKPLATPAESESNIAFFVLAITAAIFVVVAGLIVFTIVRFRQRSGDDSRLEPPQVYGSNQIEAAWTVIPILIVFVLIGVSARVIAGVQNASPPPSTLKITVIGHQWWWEVVYPEYGIVTANEIHIPVAPDGKAATYLRLESMDVIHSFWVPQLSGKTDLIPNRINYMWIDPRQLGVYVGNCAEYCGTQHANMFLRVVAETPNDFHRWAAEQQKAAHEDPQVSEAKVAFGTLACVNCHSVRGTPAAGRFGPDLTHLMSRKTLAAGVLTNTAQNLRSWVNNPQQAKPGCFMPSMELTDEQLNQVVSYLQSLK